jgi:hypothetical protein
VTGEVNLRKKKMNLHISGKNLEYESFVAAGASPVFFIEISTPSNFSLN